MFSFFVPCFQAAFVFATAPDIFQFNPGKLECKEAENISNTIEFLRRFCLCIKDRTNFPAINKLNT